MCCGSLTGVRVLECAHYIAGPRCSQLLADHGANVVKLEPPAGDPSRGALPRYEGQSLYFASHNRRKRSAAVDLKHPQGRELLARFLRWADVVVTNYTPHAAARLGLDFDSARAVNPRIVVVNITALGLDNDDPTAGGFDGTIQSRSGIADLIGAADGPPTVTLMPIIDHITAIDGAYGAMLALRKRDATGEGQQVDVAMLDVAMSLLAYAYGDVLLRDTRPQRDGSRAPYAFTTTYRASDGYVFIAPMGAMWIALARIVGHPEWAELGSEYVADPDARIRDRALIEPQIEAWTSQHPRAEIIQTLTDAGIACGPVNRIDEAVRDPLVTSRGMIQWITAGQPPHRIPVPGVELKLSSAGPPADLPRVPELGADTDSVLQELGVDTAAVAELRAAGAIP